MKCFVMISFLLTCVYGLFGQNEMSVKTFLEGDGYTYVHELIYGGYKVLLYNEENRLTHVDVIYKDTGEEPPFNLREECVVDEAWSYDKTMSIINNAFTLDQKLSVSEHPLCVSIYIDSTTGKLTEVDFIFRKKSPFSQIPLSVFREIEVKLKEEIYFTLTEAGRKRNYVFFSWMHRVK